MVVKILQASSSFNGIDYNSEKVSEGVAQVLSSNNLEALAFTNFLNQSSKDDLKNYFMMVSAKNQKVKNKQFHAAISCKGREYTPEQLKDIGEEYLKRMGYGDNPYVIYFHNDTDNNHIHVVSTRVKYDGKTVNSSFENVRSLEIINELINRDLKKEAKSDLDAIKAFSFSTHAQAKLLLEAKGWKVYEKDGNYKLLKGGTTYHQFDKKEIEDKINSYSTDEKRIKQLSAILDKYSKGLEPLALSRFMKANFGCELKFHTSKDHNRPYGYSIIDNKNKNVFKGSEVYSLHKILDNKELQSKISIAESVLNTTLDSKPGLTFKELKNELANYNLSLKRNNVYMKGIKQPLYKLDDTIYKQLRYNDRLLEANKFNAIDKGEAQAIAKLFYVKIQDITVNPFADKKEYLHNEITAIVNNQRTIDNKDWLFIKQGKEHFLIDKSDNQIINVSEHARYLGTETNIVTDTSLERYNETINDVSPGQLFINMIMDALQQDFGSGEMDSNNKRKRNNNSNNINR